MSPALLTCSMGTTVADRGLCSQVSCLLAGKMYASILPEVWIQKLFVSSAVSGEMPHVRASPGIMASLQHTRTYKQRTQWGTFQEMEAWPAVPILSQGHLCEPWSAVQIREETR